jgi:hypothetical protein
MMQAKNSHHIIIIFEDFYIFSNINTVAAVAEYFCVVTEFNIYELTI